MHAVSESYMNDPVRLRAALFIACCALVDSNPSVGWQLAEDFYDSSDEFLELLTQKHPEPEQMGKLLKFPG